MSKGVFMPEISTNPDTSPPQISTNPDASLPASVLPLSVSASVPPPHPTVPAPAKAAWLLPNKPIARFVVLAVLGVVLLTLLWSVVAPWLAGPAALLSSWVLDIGASGWVQRTRMEGTLLSVYSSLQVSTAQTGWRPSEVIIDINPARYGYSLPILWALFLAASGPGRVWRMAAGAVLLVPLHAFSIVTQVLMQLCLAVQLNPQVLHIQTWQLEALVYAYQLGSLVIPSLSPLLLWLWLDQAFVRRTFAGMVRH